MIELKVKEGLFNNIGVEIAQLYCNLDKDGDFRVCGSVSSNNEKLEGYLLYLKINLCNEKGEILYTEKTYRGISFEMVNYDAFSMCCSNISRFLNIDQLHHIEIYPNLRKEDVED